MGLPIAGATNASSKARDVNPLGSIYVASEKLRDPVDVILRHSAIDVDVLGAGYDPDPVLPIIGDNVQLHGLLGRDHPGETGELSLLRLLVGHSYSAPDTKAVPSPACSCRLIYW